MEALIHSNERLDDLCRKGYRLIQDPKLFCFGIDAVLLSDYAKVKRGERAVDLCTGNGVIPILLEAKNNGEHYSGLELQPQCADLAKRSVKYNHLEDKVTIEEGDVCNASEIFGRESVEVVTVNPPYMIGQHGIKNADDAMTIARHEVRCTLDDIVRESAKMLKFNGRFYMVHRPFRLAEIFSTMMKYHIEPKRMRLVHPYADREPNMVLIEGLQGGKSRITIEKPLVVYKEPNVYTDEIYEIYGDVVKMIKAYMQTNGLSPKDTVILACTKESIVLMMNRFSKMDSNVRIESAIGLVSGMDIEKYMKEKDERPNDDAVYDKGRKYAFDVGSESVKMSTVHSYKGYETDNVIFLMDCGKDFNESLALAYTAITRSRKNLFVIGFKDCGNQQVKDYFKNTYTDYVPF